MYVVSLHAGLKLNEAYKINRHQDNRTLIKKFKTHRNGQHFKFSGSIKCHVCLFSAKVIHVKQLCFSNNRQMSSLFRKSLGSRGSWAWCAILYWGEKSRLSTKSVLKKGFWWGIQVTVENHVSIWYMIWYRKRRMWCFQAKGLNTDLNLQC